MAWTTATKKTLNDLKRQLEPSGLTEVEVGLPSGGGKAKVICKITKANAVNDEGRFAHAVAAGSDEVVLSKWLRAPSRKNLLLHFCKEAPSTCDARPRGGSNAVLHVRRWRPLALPAFKGVYAFYKANGLTTNPEKTFGFAAARGGRALTNNLLTNKVSNKLTK